MPLNVSKFISGYYQNKIPIIRNFDEEIAETYASKKTELTLTVENVSLVETFN